MPRPSATVPASRRGSVLVIVMVTLIFATFALLAFMEKASVDLLVEQRAAVARRLRVEAYSALEVTIAVLNEFREAGNGLRSPAEGWGDPLAFAGHQPSEGCSVEIGFEDESGKISLPRADAATLTRLFRQWELPVTESEELADALIGWMKRGHVYATSMRPDYDSGAIPYDAPARPLRSFNELAAIAKVRDAFYDEAGRPNDLWRRFADSVSLLDFQRPNLNGARPDTLAALGRFDAAQLQTLGDYLGGAGAFPGQGQRYFRDAAEAQRVAGPAGDTGAFTAAISALRITVTVREGRNEFRLLVVVAPPGGAVAVQAIANPERPRGSLTSAQQQERANASQATPRPDAAAPNAAAGGLRYPFTLLEIRENDEIPPSTPPSNPPP